MKRRTALLTTIFWTILLLGACNDSVWEQLPSSVSQFVTEYYPGSDIKSYNTDADGNQTVEIKNGAVLKFDRDGAWTEISGRGVPLPEVLVLDELPSPLYRYLQEITATTLVYKMSRTPREYTLLLTDSMLEYDIATEKVSYRESTL